VIGVRYAVLVLTLAACGDDGPGAVDSAVDADASTDAGALPMPAPPAPPELPVLTPCPDGYRELATEDGFAVCEPWPESGREDCAPGEAHFPGTPGCAALGPACPADGFPADLPSGRPVIYVQASAVGGDGSRGAPFGTIAEATTAAVVGSVIALSVGEYVEEVALPPGVALVGACVVGTTIRSDTARIDRGVVNPEGAGVEVSGFTIGPSPRPGLWVVGDDVSVTARDLEIIGGRIAGISVELGASFEGERIVIRDFVPAPLVPAGRGLNVETGAIATARWIDVRDCIDFGVFSYGGAQLTLSDSVVRGTRTASPERNGGPGIGALLGGHIEAERVVVEDNQQVGVLALDDDTSVRVQDAVIRGTAPWGPDGVGRGLDVESGAELTCERCLIEDCRDMGAAAQGGVLTLTDVAIRRTVPGDRGQAGRGVSLQPGADGELTRVAIADGWELGMLVGGASVTGTDVTIRRIVPQMSDETAGRGIAFQAGATGELSRVAISNVTEIGVLLGQAGTSVRLSDIVITDVASRPSGFFGRGLTLQNEAELWLTRGRIERVHEVGAMCSLGSRLVLEDVVISEVEPQPCGDGGGCSALPGGHGLGAYADSTIEATRFVVSDIALCGLHVALDGSMTGADGLVTRSAIGACIQSDAQRLEDVSNDVAYVDNGSNLEATSLPVPETLGLSE